MSAPLERRYRRLLALHPPAYRARFGDEMLAALMAGAPDDGRRPAAAAAWVLGVALPIVGGIVTELAGIRTGYLGGFRGVGWTAVALVAAAGLTWTGGPWQLRPGRAAP